eukprot:945212-Amphidinium_carterae.1
MLYNHCTVSGILSEPTPQLQKEKRESARLPCTSNSTCPSNSVLQRQARATQPRWISYRRRVLSENAAEAVLPMPTKAFAYGLQTPEVGGDC